MFTVPVRAYKALLVTLRAFNFRGSTEGAFCGIFQGIVSAKYDRSDVLFQNWYLLGRSLTYRILLPLRGSFQNISRPPLPSPGFNESVDVVLLVGKNKNASCLCYLGLIKKVLLGLCFCRHKLFLHYRDFKLQMKTGTPTVKRKFGFARVAGINCILTTL